MIHFGNGHEDAGESAALKIKLNLRINYVNNEESAVVILEIIASLFDDKY